MNCYVKQRFNADIIRLYISAMNPARKLKFGSYFHCLSIHQIFQFRHTRVILCNVGEVYIFKHGLYISALKRASMLFSVGFFYVKHNLKILSRLSDFVTCNRCDIAQVWNIIGR